MMNFDEFTENVIQDIRSRAEGELHILKKNVVKNNNVRVTGIAVRAGDENSGPCVYLESFFQEYKSGGMKFCEIVEELYRLLMKHRDDMKGVDVSAFLNWEAIRRNVYAKLINEEQNREQLGKMPHRMFLDLAVVYYAVIRDSGKEEVGTVLVRNEHMEQWGQEEEILYQTAMGNMRADGEADFAALETVIKRNSLDFDLLLRDKERKKDTGMYILTNRCKRFGAAEMLDKNTLRMIAGQVGDGFIVLPSSVHETIVLPPKDGSEYKTLAEMVRDINDTEVDADERLSYHVYVYSRDEEMLKIVA